LYLIRHGLSRAIDVNNRVPWKNRQYKNKNDDDSDNYPLNNPPTNKALSSRRLCRRLRDNCGTFHRRTALRAELIATLQIMAALHAKTRGQLLNR
jgi:hypothetical protein